MLVLGGSGSWGRAFIRKVLADNLAARVISVSRNAEMRYRLEQAHTGDPRLIVLPGDVRQRDDLKLAFDLGVDVVVHAAAEKHVGTGQKYRQYAWDINVGGALNVIELAVTYLVPTVVALSTDKACNPINWYGTTKSEAERLFVGANANAGARFVCVRYGNVVGSSGSVIPLFLKQRASGELTITDRRMSRYWMPLSDDVHADLRVLQEPGSQPVMSAVRWVLTALEHARGGEILIPEIPSATVEDVARAVAPDATLVEIGIRDGEKIHEQLIDVSEGSRSWRVPFGGWAILPHGANASVRGWTRVPAGFSYSSDQHLQPVRVEQVA